MFIIIDNTKNLSKAYMTPLLISYFENLSIQYKIISDNQDIDDIIENKNIKGFILSGGPICLSKQDLDENWLVVSEAIQTILRREGFKNPYELLKNLTRKNKIVGESEIKDFINSLKINNKVKKELLKIKPENYTGKS